MTRTAVLLASALGLGGGLLLSAGPVQASACSAEIRSVQQQLTSTPTMASGGYGEPGATAPNTANVGAGHAPLPAPAPAQTEPMDEDEIQSGEVMPGGSTDPDEAAKALARARAFDQAGDEAACMNAVEEAKSYLGEE